MDCNTDRKSFCGHMEARVMQCGVILTNANAQPQENRRNLSRVFAEILRGEHWCRCVIYIFCAENTCKTRRNLLG